MHMIKLYGVRCYARRLGASRCNAHVKAQAALGPGLRRTSHAIASPLSFFFFVFHFPLDGYSATGRRRYTSGWSAGVFDHPIKGSVEWSRHERHFCSLLPYFLLSWLQIFQLCLSFWTSSFDMVLFKKLLQEKEKYPKNLPKRLSS